MGFQAVIDFVHACASSHPNRVWTTFYFMGDLDITMGGWEARPQTAFWVGDLQQALEEAAHDEASNDSDAPESSDSSSDRDGTSDDEQQADVDPCFKDGCTEPSVGTKCTKCREVFCEDHIGPCTDCSDEVCDDCTEECDLTEITRCDNRLCEKCINDCDCDRSVCSECWDGIKCLECMAEP